MRSAWLGAVGVVALLSCTSRAQEWINPAGGVFDEPANWQGGVVPGPLSIALWSLPGSYTVTLAQSRLVDEARFRHGAISLELGGHSLTTLGTGSFDFQVGSRPGDVGLLRVHGGMIQTMGVTVGYDRSGASRARGTLIVEGADASIAANGPFEVGHQGDGELHLLAGGSAGALSTALGWAAGATGFASISGAASLLEVRDLYLGTSGHGRVDIHGGGRVETARVVKFAVAPGASGQAVVRGTGTNWIHRRGPSNNEFLIGEGGAGTLCVLDGGVLDSDQPIQVGLTGTVCGNSQITGSLENSGAVRPGGSYDELQRLVDPTGIGTLSIVGGFTQSTAGLLEIEAAGRTVGMFDRLVIDGAAQLSGSLHVSLSPGYAPAFGDTLTILESAGVSGTFGSTTLPALAGGLGFEVRYLPSSVQVVVIPGPPAGVLMAGLPGLARRGRRR